MSTAGAAFASTAIPGADPTAAPGSFTEQNLAADRTANNWFYRIPALAHLGDGVVLSSWDARPGSAADSPNPNTIVQRRSTDNGKTWGPMTTIAAGHIADASGPKYGYSDPSYVVDAESGKVFAFFVYSKDQGFHGSAWGNDDANRQVISAAVVESTDGGLTWSEPRLITDVVKPGSGSTPTAGAVRSMFATSGQGIQLTRGEHAGRLIQQYAGDVQLANGSRTYQSYSVYSDDHGATWQRGEFTGSAMDENKVVELSDGRVMLNSRDSGNGGYRKVAISTNGGESYSEVKQDKNLPDPTNNAHITQLVPGAAAGSKDAKKLLYTGANSQTGRENVSARVSCDDGASWPGLRTIRHGFSAYSSATALADGKFGVLYEGNYTDSMPFASFDEEWLNYVCAPQAAADFTADAGATHKLSVTITNQEDTALNGALTLAASQKFASNTVDIANLPAGESRTVELDVKVPVTANGKYLLQTIFTAADGTTAQGNLRATIAGKEVTGIEVAGNRTDTGRDLAANPYAAGDALPYAFKVTSASNIAPVGRAHRGQLRTVRGQARRRGQPRRQLPLRQPGRRHLLHLLHAAPHRDRRRGGRRLLRPHHQVDGRPHQRQLRRGQQLRHRGRRGRPAGARAPARGNGRRTGPAGRRRRLLRLRRRRRDPRGQPEERGQRPADRHFRCRTHRRRTGRGFIHRLHGQAHAHGGRPGRGHAGRAFARVQRGQRRHRRRGIGRTRRIQAPRRPGRHCNQRPGQGRALPRQRAGHRPGGRRLQGHHGPRRRQQRQHLHAVRERREDLHAEAHGQHPRGPKGHGQGRRQDQRHLPLPRGTGQRRRNHQDRHACREGEGRESRHSRSSTLEGAKFAKDYTLTTNLWWGTNATEYTLYENGTVVDQQTLAAATPAAQKASTSFADKAPGTYRYTAVLGNAAGSTESKTLVVKVK